MSIDATDLKEVLNYIQRIKNYDATQSYHLAAISELAWIFMLSSAGIMDFLIKITDSPIHDTIPWLIGSFGGAVMSVFIFSSPKFITEDTNIYTKSMSSIMKGILVGMISLWVLITVLVIVFGTDFILIGVTFSVALAHMFFKYKMSGPGSYDYQRFVFRDSHTVFLSLAALIDIILYLIMGSSVVSYFSLIFPGAYSLASILNIIEIRKQTKVSLRTDT